MGIIPPEQSKKILVQSTALCVWDPQLGKGMTARERTESIALLLSPLSGLGRPELRLCSLAELFLSG